MTIDTKALREKWTAELRGSTANNYQNDASVAREVLSLIDALEEARRSEQNLQALANRDGGQNSRTAEDAVVALLTDLDAALEEVAEARDLLGTSEALKTHFEEEYLKARLIAFEEYARAMDRWHQDREEERPPGEIIRDLATLPPTLVAVERADLEKVKAALLVTPGQWNHPDVMAALSLLERVKR